VGDEFTSDTSDVSASHSIQDGVLRFWREVSNGDEHTMTVNRSEDEKDSEMPAIAIDNFMCA
jgi:hypothetical protein